VQRYEISQRRSKHVAQRFGRPAAKAFDIAGHNVECPRRETRLNAGDDVDGSCWQTGLRQPGTQLFFRDDKKCERPTGDFGDDSRALRTRQALGASRVVDRAGMAVADQNSGCGGRHVIARNETGPVLGQPGQHTLAQRRLRLLQESFGIEVHAQDRPGRCRGDKMLLAAPVGGAARRLLLPPRADGRHEDDMLDARLHGRVDRSDVLRPALSGFRIDSRDDEQTIETRIGLGKAFGPVVVPESSLSQRRDGFGRARDRHYFVPARTLQQFRNDSSAQMAAGATHTDFHVNLQHRELFVSSRK